MTELHIFGIKLWHEYLMCGLIPPMLFILAYMYKEFYYIQMET